ncbi:MAG: inositol monophosphatase family protein [Polyangiales bacterium]
MRNAGKKALDLYASGAAARATKKPDRSPVTEADKAVEAHLREVFDKHFPTFAFLGEETGKKESASGLRFIVDPIDGTRLPQGIPTWSVLLGIECDGVPVVGIAHFPADGDMLVGATGPGVTHNGGHLSR